MHSDITRNKHKGAATSVAANPTRSAKEHDCERILRFMEVMGGKTWLKQVVRDMQIPVQTASARLADLKEQRKIEVVVGERREGCSVVQLTQPQGRLF